MARLIDGDALAESLRESKDKLGKILSEERCEMEYRICEGQMNTFIEAILRVYEAPTIDAEPVRHGEWKWVFNRKADTWGDDCYESGWECSECGAGADIYTSHHKVEESCEESEKGITDERTIYCHNCGAKMDGGEEDA